jgi:hypothetical protein
MNEKHKVIVLLILSLLLISAGLGCFGQDEKNRDNEKDDKVELKLIMPDKTEKSFTTDDLQNFNPIERNVSYQNKMGNYNDICNYKAVLMKDLLSSVSVNFNPGDTIRITAEDGYSQKYCYYNVYPPSSWYQFQGDFGIAYELNGETIPSWKDGPMPVFLPEDNKYSQEDCNATSALGQGYFKNPSAGARFVRNTVKIEVISNNVEEWGVDLSGVLTETIKKTDFEMMEYYYKASFINESNASFTGVPLWHLLGRVDDLGPIRGENAFNMTMSATDYKVKIIAGDDYSITLTSTELAKNNKILLTNQLDGSELPDDKKPLWLVGEGLKTSQMVFNVVKIEIQS